MVTDLVRKAPHSFSISGCVVSDNNGVYAQSGPRVNGMPAYCKEGDVDRWCCYSCYGTEHWALQPGVFEGEVYAQSMEEETPWEGSGKAWQEFLAGDWIKSSPVISILEKTKAARTCHRPRPRIPDGIAVLDGGLRGVS